MRAIDADALLKKTINNPLHAPYIVEKDIKEQSTIQPVATDTIVGDTISRQAAIDALDEERKQRHLFNTAEDGLLEARRIINTLPSAQPEQRWIPVTERLPEESQAILATTTDNAWGDVVIIRTYYREMHKSVTAWMPLPKPCKEEMSEE